MTAFKVEVTGIAKAQAFLKSRADSIKLSLHDSLRRAVIDLVRYVKEQKLSDQVLRVRTGRLRRSITSDVQDNDGRLEGIVGTNVKYARVHELGFKGTVKVRDHTRRSIKGKAFTVRAHSRKVDIPARPFLNPSLQERFPEYQKWFAKAVEDGTRGARS